LPPITHIPVRFLFSPNRTPRPPSRRIFFPPRYSSAAAGPQQGLVPLAVAGHGGCARAILLWQRLLLLLRRLWRCRHGWRRRRRELGSTASSSKTSESSSCRCTATTACTRSPGPATLQGRRRFPRRKTPVRSHMHTLHTEQDAMHMHTLHTRHTPCTGTHMHTRHAHAHTAHTPHTMHRHSTHTHSLQRTAYREKSEGKRRQSIQTIIFRSWSCCLSQTHLLSSKGRVQLHGGAANWWSCCSRVGLVELELSQTRP
jgi:hypothetical protein